MWTAGRRLRVVRFIGDGTSTSPRVIGDREFALVEKEERATRLPGRVEAPPERKVAFAGYDDSSDFAESFKSSRGDDDNEKSPTELARAWANAPRIGVGPCKPCAE